MKNFVVIAAAAIVLACEISSACLSAVTKEVVYKIRLAGVKEVVLTLGGPESVRTEAHMSLNVSGEEQIVNVRFDEEAVSVITDSENKTMVILPNNKPGLTQVELIIQNKKTKAKRALKQNIRVELLPTYRC